jgi:hypothetical protein
LYLPILTLQGRRKNVQTYGETVAFALLGAFAFTNLYSDDECFIAEKEAQSQLFR